MSRKTPDPFNIENIDYIETEDTSAMNAAVSDIIENISFDVQLTGASLPAYLIAQTASAIPELADWVAPKAPYGIKVSTYHGLISELWEIFGDERVIAHQVQIRNAARRAYAASSGRQPTSDALDLATEMIDMCLGADDTAVAEAAENPRLPLALSVPAHMLSSYEQDLARRHLVDPRRAAVLISEMICDGIIPSFSMIIEDPSEDDASLIRFVVRCANSLDIHIVRRDASEIDLGDRAKQANSVFAVAFGSHVQGRLAASCIQEMMEAGAAPDEIAIAINDTATAPSILFDALASAQIPFECSYQVPASATPLGRWFCSLLALSRSDVFGEDAVAALTAVAESPYTAFDDPVFAARALAEALGIIEPEEGEQIEVPQDSRLSQIIALVKGKRHPVAWLAFAAEEASSPYAGERQQEDAKIARALHEHLDACDMANDKVNLEDISQVAISLTRTYGKEPRVKIVPYARASYEPARFWVLAGMDAKSFPGYRAPGPFQSAMETFGMSPDPWQMKRAVRFQVADILRKSKEGFAVLLRPATDVQGSPAPPAPLLAEIAEMWGGLDSDGFPKSLPDEFCRSLSESQVRSYLSKKAAASHDCLQGGGLASAAPRSTGHSFSPTELELYWMCPRKWLFSRNGIGYSDPPATTATDPRISGTLVHDAMSIYYRAYGKDHPRMSPDDPVAAAELDDAITKAVEEHASWIAEQGATPAEEYTIAQARRRCYDLLDQDRSFLPGFTPARFETGISVNVAGIPLYGVVDRLDLGPVVNGKRQAVIVDYKSRADSEYGWQKKADEPGLHIQGLVYAEMVEAKYPDLDVVGIVYRGYADGSVKSISFVPTDADTPPDSDEQAYRDHRDAFKQHLAAIAAGIAHGDFPMSPRNLKKAACSYCNASGICPGEAR